MKNFIRSKYQNIVPKKGLFEIYAQALEKERKGEKVVHMEIGKPDFDTPKIIKESAKKALDDGNIYYTEPRGIIELRKAICDYTYKKIGLKYNELEILITVGASEALDLIWKAILDEDDEIIIPSPYYSAYTHQLEYADKSYVTVPIINEDGSLDYSIDKFEKALTKKTKAILINSPNNPTGYVMNEEELNNIVKFAKDNNLLVISDECYDHYVFEGEYKSIASFEGMKERTIIVNSTSKTFAMTGWRVGYVIASKEVIEMLMKIHAQTIVCPTSFAQVGAITAYTKEIKELEIMMNEFKRRRDYLKKGLLDIKNIRIIEPKGAFYIFMYVGDLNMKGIDFCEKLLDRKGVTISPGDNFGDEWDDYVRISYACSFEDIEYAVKSIREFVGELE